MEITGTLVMAADTVLLPVSELSEEMRRQVQAEEGDYAVSRPNSRTLARIIDGDAAKLLAEFREPTTVVQAILRYCGASKEDPEATLDAAFPMIERLVDARLLVAVGSPQTQSILPQLEPGSRFAGTQVLACVQCLEDTDIYRVQLSGGESAALKLLRPSADAEIKLLFQREALVLKHLDGTVTPALLASNVEGEPTFLLLSWCDGSDCASTASRLRSSRDRAALLRLSVAILKAYVHLHEQNVIHSDIHPYNILVSDDLTVCLIDFGLARIADAENPARRSPRGGVGYYFEPEYASAVRRGGPPPQSSMAGEQYSLAALLFFLLTGMHYVDFSLEKQEMLNQIAEAAPLSFASRGLQRWPAVEAILARALSKDPADRFPSVAFFAAELAAVADSQTPVSSGAINSASHHGAFQTLVRTLDRFSIAAPSLRSGLSSAPKASVNYGSAGIACALHGIACAREDAEILSLADLWGERAVRDAHAEEAWYSPAIGITPENVGHASLYHTESGVHYVRALIGHSMGDAATHRRSIERFLAATRIPCDNLDLTLGRSGHLLAAAQLLSTLKTGSPVSFPALGDAGNIILAEIWQQLDSYGPILECLEIRSSGIAHGWAGILYATLCWCRACGTPLPANTTERLDQLAALARHSGRHAKWSWRIGSELGDGPASFMGGWCNGSAGLAHLWLAAYSALKDDRYLSLAEKAAWHASEADTRNGSLCCGFTGQAYALLALYRLTDDPVWLSRAQSLAERAAEAYRYLPNGSYVSAAQSPDSLYKGELGVAVLAADLANPSGSAQPAFEWIEF